MVFTRLDVVKKSFEFEQYYVGEKILGSGYRGAWQGIHCI